MLHGLGCPGLMVQEIDGLMEENSNTPLLQHSALFLTNHKFSPPDQIYPDILDTTDIKGKEPLELKAFI